MAPCGLVPGPAPETCGPPPRRLVIWPHLKLVFFKLFFFSQMTGLAENVEGVCPNCGWFFFLRFICVCENMVLRRISGPRRDELTGEWRRLHNEELNDLYSSPNIVRVIRSRRMRWSGHVARMGEERGVYGILVGKPEGRRPLGRPRRGWVDNIRMDLQEVVCGYMDWIRLAQDRDRWRTLVSAVMNLWVPWNEGNFLSSCKPVSFSRTTLHRVVSKYEFTNAVFPIIPVTSQRPFQASVPGWRASWFGPDRCTGSSVLECLAAIIVGAIWLISAERNCHERHEKSCIRVLNNVNITGVLISP